MAGDHTTWLALWHQFLEADTRLTNATARWDEAKLAAEQEYPVQRIKMWDPTSERPGMRADSSGSSWATWSPPLFPYRNELTRDQINEHYDRHIGGGANGRAELMSEGEAHRAEALAHFDSWLADCTMVDLRYNVPVLAAARNAAAAAFEVMQNVILNTSATDVIGIAVKFAVRRFCEGNDDEPEISAAMADALRLAELPEDFGIAA